MAFEEASGGPVPLDGVERLVVFHKPTHSLAASHIENQDRAILEILCRGEGLDITYRSTVPNQQDTEAELSELIEPRDLLVSLVGDGSARRINSALAALNLANPHAIWPRGGVNDLTRQLYTPGDFREPWRPLFTGAVHRVQPLRMKITKNSGDVTYEDIWNYATHGRATVGVAAAANTLEYRNNLLHSLPGGRKALEIGFALREYIFQGGLQTLHENGVADRRFMDRIIANGDDMARYLHFGADLLTPGGRVIDSASRLKGLGLMVKMRRAKEVGAPIQTPLKYQIIGQYVLMQIEGDEEIFEGPTTFEITVNDKSAALVTSRTVPVRHNNPAARQALNS